MTTPDKGYVEAYLVEISKAYGLSWRPDGWVEVSAETLGGGEEESAQEKQRILEAEVSNASAGDDIRQASQQDDGDDHDGEGGSGGGGSLALPSTPSSAPKLTNVKSSTSSIPIIHPSNNHHSANDSESDNLEQDNEEEGNVLPAIPPTDPAQSSRTVIIKTMSPQSKASSIAPHPQKPAATAPPPKHSENAADDKRYDVSFRAYTMILALALLMSDSTGFGETVRSLEAEIAVVPLKSTRRTQQSIRKSSM